MVCVYVFVRVCMWFFFVSVCVSDRLIVRVFGCWCVLVCLFACVSLCVCVLV